MSNRPLILLVEDNEVNQLLTSSVLEREGFAVDIAGTSVQALEMLRSRVPDLILMDIQLPGLDGLSFTRTLKADPSTEPIPIVALTAHAMNGDREQSLAAGCVGYVSKPIDTRTFGRQVREFLSCGMPAPGPGEDRCQTKRPVTSEPLILLVEDNASNQLLVRSVLEPAGFRVEVASTATQALEHLKTQTPSLILMDLELPGKDGLALTRLLKSMSPTTAIPVVAMTAHTSLQWRNDALQAGCAGFISKPIDVHTFPARVSEFVAGAKK